MMHMTETSVTTDKNEKTMNVPGWIKTHRVAAACAAGALVLAVGGGVAWGMIASQSPEVEVTTPSESPKPTSTSKPSTAPTPKPSTTTKPTPTTTTTPEEKPKEQSRTDTSKTQNPGTTDKQPPAPQPPAPQPPPAPEPPPPPPPEPEPEPESPRGDANAELSSRYGTNYNGITRCGNANYGSATSAASLPPWAGVGNVGWSVWVEGDRWHVQYLSCE